MSDSNEIGDEEHIKRKLDHADKWLSDYKKAKEYLPEVQYIRDSLQWQYESVHNAPPGVSPLPGSVSSNPADHDWHQFTRGLPALTPPDFTSFSASTALAVGSSNSVFCHFTSLTESDNVGVRNYSKERLAEYQRIQKKHEVWSKVVTLLEPLDTGNLVGIFLQARKAYHQVVSDPDSIKGTALEIRTFIDKLKGDLFQKARRRERENMTWEIMADRLAIKDKDNTAKKELLRQGTIRSKLIDQLSTIGKGRYGGSDPGKEIERLWAEAIDHTLVMLKAIGVVPAK